MGYQATSSWIEIRLQPDTAATTALLAVQVRFIGNSKGELKQNLKERRRKVTSQEEKK
jgi:hypothetical protein